MAWKGWEDFAGSAPAAPKPHKYGAVSTLVDGIKFSSKKEAGRYTELRMRQRAGDVRALKLQPRYALCPLVLEGADVRDANAGKPTMRRMFVASYVADFEYEESDRGYGGITWTLVVEDVKGKRTETYLLKKRWFEAQYGVRIREI